jgi:hypothetical protein
LLELTADAPDDQIPMGPEVALDGTTIVSCVGLAAMTFAGVPLTTAASLAGLTSKFKPDTKTVVPGGPIVGVNPVIDGISPEPVTENVVVLEAAWLATVTVIMPVVAPDGTTAINWDGVAETTEAAAPKTPNVTKLLAGVGSKFVPVIVICVPNGPLAGINPLITGATKKLLALAPV